MPTSRHGASRIPRQGVGLFVQSRVHEDAERPTVAPERVYA